MDHEDWNVFNDGDEDEFRQFKLKGRDYLIFMVDCSKSMLESKSEDQTGAVITRFESCFKVITNMYKMRCVTGDKDYLGVLLYNTKESKNSHNFGNIYVFNDLTLPDAGRVKHLEAVANDSGKKFKKDVGCGEAKLDEAFWMAGTMFSAQGAKEGTKRIILFTDCDEPHGDDPALQRRIVLKIKDLLEQNVGISLLPVGDPEFRNFNWSAFYQTALGKPATECVEIASSGYEELEDRVARKSLKARPTANVTFQIGPDVELGIGLYNMYSIARIPTATTLERKTNEPVTSARTFMDAETGEKILQIDLKKFQTYGGKKIAFERDEVDQLKTNIAKEVDETGLGVLGTSAGLVLLGFKPQSYLKPYHYVQPGLFACAEDKLVQGSSRLFRALLERCAARQVMAICRMVARGNMAPRLVALLPQLEELAAQGGYQTSPPGFLVVYLPYADDVRNLEKVVEQRVRVKPSVDQVELAKAIINKLTPATAFSPETTSNPALQKHYRAVEAIALELESVEEIEDGTQPRYDWFQKKAKRELDDFAKTMFSEDYATESKRKKADASKAEGVDLEGEARAQRLEKLTVPVLRELASQAGVKLSGTRKADIIQKINRHFGL